MADVTIKISVKTLDMDKIIKEHTKLTRAMEDEIPLIASQQLHLMTDAVMRGYYDEYQPKYYYRRGPKYKNALRWSYKPVAKVTYGGVYISDDKMTDYKNGSRTIDKSWVWGNSWKEGYHGSPHPKEGQEAIPFIGKKSKQYMKKITKEWNRMTHNIPLKKQDGQWYSPLDLVKEVKEISKPFVVNRAYKNAMRRLRLHYISLTIS